MCSDILATGMHVICSILINCHVLFKLLEKWFWRWAHFRPKHVCLIVCQLSWLWVQSLLDRNWTQLQGELSLPTAEDSAAVYPGIKCMLWERLAGGLSQEGTFCLLLFAHQGLQPTALPRVLQSLCWMLCLLTFHPICWLNLFSLAPYLRHLLIQN